MTDWTTKTKRKLNQVLIFYYTLAILAALATGYLIRHMFIESYRIPTDVMRPLLEPGDFIFVSKPPFGIRMPFSTQRLSLPRKPHYTEIVVYASPDRIPRHLIRRVIGLPGDRVALKKGRVVLNGKELSFTPGPDQVCGTEGHPAGTYQICLDPPVIDEGAEVKVPEDQIFVLGDLRSKTVMNDDWGLIPIEGLEGRPLFIWFSVNPQSPTASARMFPKIRTERLFRKIQ